MIGYMMSSHKKDPHRAAHAEGAKVLAEGPDTNNDTPLSHELAEAAVLGAMMLSAQACEGAREQLCPTDFDREAHRTVFEAIARLASAGDPVDAVTVTIELMDTGKIDHVGGPVALADLTDLRLCPTPAAWPYYAGVVRAAGHRREVLRVLRAKIREIEGGADPDRVLNGWEMAA